MDAIRAVWTTVDERWNARDAEGFSNLFSDEARFGFVNRGEWMDGRAEILRSFLVRFPTITPEIRHQSTTHEVRSIAPGVTMVDGAVRILRTGPDERTEPDVILTFHFFAVMLQTEDGWRIDELRVVDLPSARNS